MRRLAIFFLLFSFVITSSNSSKHMFSFEQGSVEIESYNLNHALNSLPYDICYTCDKVNDSLAPARNYNHPHVILLNSIARSKGDIATYFKNQIPTAVSFPTPYYLHSLIPANTLPTHSIFKFFSPTPHNLQQSTVLLI